MGSQAEVLVDTINHRVLFRNLRIGKTYSTAFQFIDTNDHTSNILAVGPFTVTGTSTGGSIGGVATKSASAPGVPDAEMCPADQILSQNLRAPSRNGFYNPYTKGVVHEADRLQGHLNRLGFNSGKVDGWLDQFLMEQLRDSRYISEQNLMVT